MGQKQVGGTSGNATRWLMWTSWAEGPVSTLYDSIIVFNWLCLTADLTTQQLQLQDDDQ